MNKQIFKSKRREWLRRYVPAEILGTVIALAAAWFIYDHVHSYIAATAAGWLGEGIGFYGYFIVSEFLSNGQKYRDQPFIRRVIKIIAGASTNLIVEFLPAELFDNFLIRPFTMFLAPHYIHPYPIGFLVGKFSADIIFYILAIVGYETRKRWLGR